MTGWHSFFSPHIGLTHCSLLFPANPQGLVFAATRNPFSLNLSDFLFHRKKRLHEFSVILIFFRSYFREKLLNEFVQEILAVFVCDVQGIMKCHKNEETINTTCRFHFTNSFSICQKKSVGVFIFFVVDGHKKPGLLCIKTFSFSLCIGLHILILQNSKLHAVIKSVTRSACLLNHYIQ